LRGNSRLCENLNFAPDGTRVAHEERRPPALKKEEGICGDQGQNERELAADGVVAGIGIEPNVELAQAAALAVDNGTSKATAAK
jgi:NAD(P)H-nitrite reductase large subunit